MLDYELGQTLLLQPEVHFQQLADTLGELGWQRAETAADPLASGEPEFASWTWGGRKPVLIYSFNPVVKLRVLDVATVPPGMRGLLAERLPLLQDRDVNDLLFDPEPRRRLLGLWAARETERLDLLPQAHRLRHDPDPTVADQGRKLNQRLDNILESRESLLVNLKLLGEVAEDIIRRLDDPIFTRQLKPTPTELEQLFDPDLTPALVPAMDRLYANAPTADPGDGYPELAVTAANAGLLRWPNELSDRFPRGYRNVAGWLQPQWIWLTWRWHNEPGTLNPRSGVHYDGLVWVETRWVWLPHPDALVAEALEQQTPDTTVH